MSTVVVKYSALDDAIQSADKVGRKMESYAEKMNSTLSILRDLPGKDDKGYAGTAISIASKKAEEATNRADQFQSFSKKLSLYRDYVKQEDKAAANGINQIVESYIGKRTLWEKIEDTIYNGYINVLNGVESLLPAGKYIAQILRKVHDKVQELTQQAYNWFHYGDGVYFMNIFNAILDVALGAIMMVDIIALAIPLIFTGPALLGILGIFGIGAGILYFGQQLIDSSITIQNNADSLSKSGKLTKYGDGDITAARYYGEIDGFEEYTKRTDFGGREENILMETLGEVYGKAKKFNKTVEKLIFLALGYYKRGIITNDKGEQVIDYQRAAEAYKGKVLHDMGLNRDPYQKNGFRDGGFDPKVAFNPFNNIFPEKYSTEMGGITGFTLDSIKSLGNIDKGLSGLSDLGSGESSWGDRVTGFLDSIGNLPIFPEPVKNFPTLADFFELIEIGANPPLVYPRPGTGHRGYPVM